MVPIADRLQLKNWWASYLGAASRYPRGDLELAACANLNHPGSETGGYVASSDSEGRPLAGATKVVAGQGQQVIDLNCKVRVLWHDPDPARE